MSTEPRRRNRQPLRIVGIDVQPAQRIPTGRQSMTVRRPRLTAISASVLVLLASLLILPSAPAADSPHQHGGVSQLHRLAIQAGSVSITGLKGHQVAAVDDAILASLMLLAAAVTALVRSRQRLRPPAGRPVPVLRSRGPPADR
jgi:hypothetical protein